MCRPLGRWVCSSFAKWLFRSSYLYIRSSLPRLVTCLFFCIFICLCLHSDANASSHAPSSGCCRSGQLSPGHGHDGQASSDEKHATGTVGRTVRMSTRTGEKVCPTKVSALLYCLSRHSFCLHSHSYLFRKYEIILCPSLPPVGHFAEAWAAHNGRCHLLNPPPPRTHPLPPAALGVYVPIYNLWLSPTSEPHLPPETAAAMPVVPTSSSPPSSTRTRQKSGSGQCRYRYPRQRIPRTRTRPLRYDYSFYSRLPLFNK